MKQLLLIIILSISFHRVYANDIFSIKILREEKLASDSLFFQLIDQQRVIQNDGILKLDIFHAPSGYRDQKMTWLQAGTCNQYLTSKGLSNSKIFLRATTTVGGIENSRSEFLIFIQDAKIVSVQHLNDSSLASLWVEAESGDLLTGFSNKIAITTLNAKTGRPKQERVSIYTDVGDTLSRFTISGKRLIDIYIEQGRKYFLQTDAGKPLELKANNFGYSIRSKQVGDSIDVELFRGKQQPVESLHFCIQVNNTIDTIASFVFDDTVSVMTTRFYWPPMLNQYTSFVLLSNSDIVLARRYWVADNELQMQSPFFTQLNNKTITIDSSFSLRFSCKGCDREKITYQVTNSNNELLGVGQVIWVSDSIFTINNLQIVGKGYLALQVNRDNVNWKPIIQTPTKTIERPAVIFYTKEDSILIWTNRNGETNKIDNVIAKGNATLLPDVSVTGFKKTRMEELEEKYVNNIMLTSLFSVNINVLDDESSRNGLTLLKYVAQKIPITQLKIVASFYTPAIKREALYFRGGEVEYWIDEIFFEGESGAQAANNIYVGDVAYIKLIKKPIRGLVGSGGSILRGGSLPPQGALVIYTKKGDEKELDKRFNQRVAIEGIDILE